MIKFDELTIMEQAILWGMKYNEFGDCFENNFGEWVFTTIDYSGLDPKIARGVIASLVKKEIVTVFDNEGKGKSNDMVIVINPEYQHFGDNIPDINPFDPDIRKAYG